MINIICEICGKTKINTRRFCNSCTANERRFWKKVKCILYLGGKCYNCGYNKCEQALCFHHLNPKLKSFNISGKHCRTWKVIEEELNKCILLCNNCHSETHAGLLTFSEEEILEFRKFCLLQNKPNLDISSEKEFRKTHNLKILHNRKFEISKNDLEDLLLKFPMVTVGKMFGVSDKAISRRAKLLGIEVSNGKGYWTKIKNREIY